MNDVVFSSKSVEWETPQWLFDWLDSIYDFKLDAAATQYNNKCGIFHKEDSLSKDWTSYGNVWCNPPYGRSVGHWVRKGFNEAQKGGIVVMLVPARTDTAWFHDYCTKASAIIYLRGRLDFKVNGNDMVYYKVSRQSIEKMKTSIPGWCIDKVKRLKEKRFSSNTDLYSKLLDLLGINIYKDYANGIVECCKIKGKATFPSMIVVFSKDPEHKVIYIDSHKIKAKWHKG